MKQFIVSSLSLSLLLLTGCSGFFVSQSTSSTSSTTSGYFYALYAGSNKLIGYYMDSGTLTVVTGAEKTVDGMLCAAVAPNNDYLFVGTTNGIYSFEISSGELTVLNGGSPISSDVVQSMQVDSTNSWLVVALQSTAEVNAISISSGVAASDTEQTVALNAATPAQLVLAPNNKHLFVALGTGGVDEIPFTAANSNPFGSAVNTATLYSSGGANTLAVDINSKFLFVGETQAYSGSSTTNTAGLRIFSISSSANTVAEVSNSPFAAGGIGPKSILADPTGNYIYIANRTVSGKSTGNITGYSYTYSGTDISLTKLSGSPWSVGTSTYGLIEDNAEDYVAAINYGGSPSISIFSLDTSTAGKLDSTATDSTYSQPIAIVALH